MIARFIMILCFMSAVASSDARVVSAPSTATVWHDARNFTLKGKAWSNTEGLYEPLPSTARTKVSPNIWRLGKYSSGLYILFTSTSGSIKLRWKNRFNATQALMSSLAVQGLDLYVKSPGGWRWGGSAKPSEKDSGANVISGMTKDEKEFMLYLPLYDGIDSLYIGTESNASIQATPAAYKQKPVLFYGTSITQGAAASRPGMTYPAIIGRALNRETINLGFSGNGKMEPAIVEFLSGTDAGMFVVDCLPNMAVVDILPRTSHLVKQIRSANPSAPILLVENISYTNAWLSKKLSELQLEKNLRLKRAFKELKEEGVKELYYIDNSNLTKPDGEGAVDGVHLTDQGFQHFAGVLINKIKKIERANPLLILLQ